MSPTPNQPGWRAGPGLWVAVGVALSTAVFAAGCSSGEEAPARDESAGQSTSTTVAGRLDGQLKLLARSGQAEAGRSDPDVDWVSDFEAATGCSVSVTTYEDDVEASALATSGEFDVVSLPATLGAGAISRREVAELDTDRLTNFALLAPYLTTQPWNSVDGSVYGVPTGWVRPMLLTAAASGIPTSSEAPTWADLLTSGDGPNAEVHLPDSPILLSQAELSGVVDPGPAELVDHPVWSTTSELVAGFVDGSIRQAVGPASLVQDLATAEPPVLVNLQQLSGPTLVSAGSWMIPVTAANPNCAYRWLDWMADPEPTAVMAEWTGQGPAVVDACNETIDAQWCERLGVPIASNSELPADIVIDADVAVMERATDWDRIRGR